MAKERIDLLASSRKNEVVPHYLRASTGSCHEFCKYGRKDAFDEKTRKSLQKRTAKPSSSEITHVEVSSKQKKEKLVNRKPSSDTKSCSLNLKNSPDIRSCPPNPKVAMVSKSYPPRRNASSGDKDILLKYRSPSSVKKHLSPNPPEIIKREVLVQSRKAEASLLKGSLNRKPSRTGGKADNQSERLLSSAKSKPFKVKPMSSENSDSVDGKGRKTSDIKTGKKIMIYKESAKKPMKLTAAPLPLKITPRHKNVPARTRKSGNLKLVSPRKERLRMGDTKTSYDKNVLEKTLHVIKMETEDSSLESISTDHAIPSFPSPESPKSFFHMKSSSLSSHEKDSEETNYKDSDTDESVTSNIESVENVKEETLTENPNKTLIKSRVIVSEDKYRSPVKLKFRSGKVMPMDLQSDNNKPRRLKFRKGRVAGAGNGKADSRVKTFKKLGDSDHATDAEISSEKVVLKHQDVQGKKDSRGLFNNVIEETASKLVESRKSKVKALVGAFETVISLQENKPSSRSVG